MAIINNTKEYKTSKHKYNVYVNLNTKTKLGKDLLDQYHEQSKRHYMDIGRIGRHDEYGRYILDEYTRKELMIVPKIIIRVTKKAMDRVGKDVYQLRTYMSKFGQLNFLLLVDKDKADLILVENIYIENVNHKEDYETLIWRLTYHNQKPVPIAEIFYKFGIKANPDDYSQEWNNNKDIKINHLIVAVATAELTKQLANKFAGDINQKTLLASLNNLNSNNYGKKVTKAYSETIAKKKEINDLATSKKLENTLNHVLIKKLEEKTTKKDLKNKENFNVYKKVLDLQMTSSQHIADQVNKYNTQETLKKFLEASYQNAKVTNVSKKVDLAEEYKKKQEEFEKIIDHKYKNKINKEESQPKEEKLDLSHIKHKKLETTTFSNFEGEKIEIDVNVDRFYVAEDRTKKKKREKEEKKLKKIKKQQTKIKAKIKKKLKQFNAECVIDEELEKSKVLVGVEVTKKQKKQDSKKEKLQKYFEKKNKQKDNLKVQNKEEQKQEHKHLHKHKEKELKQLETKQEESENLIKKIEKKIRNNNAKKEQKISKKQSRLSVKLKKKEEKALKQEKKKLFKEYGFKEKKSNKKAVKQENKVRKEEVKIQAKEKKKKKKINTALMEPIKKVKEKLSIKTIKEEKIPVKTKKEEKLSLKLEKKNKKDKKQKTKQTNATEVIVKPPKKDFYHQEENLNNKPVNNIYLQKQNQNNILKTNNNEKEKKKEVVIDTTVDVKNLNKEQEYKFTTESHQDMKKFEKTHFDISQNKRVVKKQADRTFEM